jgi:ribosomal protein S18 acetylase RimI-like enzyme
MTVCFETHDTPVAEAALVDAGLDESNHAGARLRDVRPLTVLARAPSGEAIGGAVGRTWGQTAELQQLWVAPAHRRRGYGTALIGQFEAGARKRGCTTVCLTTMSFQAPGLYRAIGYRSAAEIAGFPDGIVKYLMVRSLGD